MMVKKMQEAAEEKKIEAEIWAVGDADAVNNVEKMDVMLLGPQVRFLESKMKAIAGGKPGYNLNYIHIFKTSYLLNIVLTI